jgi:hypothetical protein
MNYVKTIILFAVIILSGCNEEDLCLKGSGTVNEYQLTVTDFDELSIYGPVNLRLRQGPDIAVSVDAEPEIFSELSYEVKNGALEIGFKQNISCFETDHGVWINATVPDLRNIYQSGVSEIESDGDLDFNQLNLYVSGTAEVKLSGQVETHKIVSSGLLNAKNFNFLTKNTSVDISGAVDLELSCSENLDIKVEGSATIYYKGNPEIVNNSTGSLQLIDSN